MIKYALSYLIDNNIDNVTWLVLQFIYFTRPNRRTEKCLNMYMPNAKQTVVRHGSPGRIYEQFNKTLNY